MGLNQAQEQEVTYLSGVTAAGTVADHAYATWNRDQPDTYGTRSIEAKWGSPTAGTGASVTVAFDPPSNWTLAEQTAFVADMHLWSAVANIRFQVIGGSSADIVIARGSDQSAATTTSFYRSGAPGSSQLGTYIDAKIHIDTSVDGFGPIGANFAVDGGYPWMTTVHEIGHAIGLGHAGPYNEGQTTSPTMLTADDSTAWSIMSYNAGDGTGQSDANDPYDWGTSADGSRDVPLTPMTLDIAAVQRIYGVPTSTPLSGGQVFGFHSNITGDIAQFFDFSINTRPIVTLWDAGGGNTLDLSGFSQNNTVSLIEGTHSSVGGLGGNLAIAFGTRIDTAIGGSSADRITGNDDGDVLMGGSGDDRLTGGAGNDHIYGNMATTAQGSSDGNDVIDTGGGTNYVNGNAGDDVITVRGDANRVYGGGGIDRIEVVSGVNHVNGNAGDDWVSVFGGTNFVFGGRDNDILDAHAGNNVLSGDAGNDRLSAGTGVDVMTGGGGHDIFTFDTSQLGALASPIDRTGDLAGYHDEITDFTVGEDVIWLLTTPSYASRPILHTPDGAGFASFGDASAYAQGQVGGSNAIAVLQVGADTYVFYDAINGNMIDSAIKLDNVPAGQIQASAFGY